eukprot:CAMPEP_0170556164 /NCGR_PEP_ID=MMETSP0211-20121228/15739_1 /TAXON_ID=311385 /ORGANISM="Pseudokeronopsis sp., Strain OXSARD2" /LENGTH=86 /DNA_ID=CAMNT_0010866337 /DNA_START=117 /DNA_END=377 /DNA_ORIENTATION=-
MFTSVYNDQLHFILHKTDSDSKIKFSQILLAGERREEEPVLGDPVLEEPGLECIKTFERKKLKMKKHRRQKRRKMLKRLLIKSGKY